MLQKRQAICLIAAAIAAAVPPALLAQSAPGTPNAGVTSQALPAQAAEAAASAPGWVAAVVPQACLLASPR